MKNIILDPIHYCLIYAASQIPMHLGNLLTIDGKSTSCLNGNGFYRKHLFSAVVKGT